MFSYSLEIGKIRDKNTIKIQEIKNIIKNKCLRFESSQVSGSRFKKFKVLKGF
jgi:hypothetical protein